MPARSKFRYRKWNGSWEEVEALHWAIEAGGTLVFYVEYDGAGGVRRSRAIPQGSWFDVEDVAEDDDGTGT